MGGAAARGAPLWDGAIWYSGSKNPLKQLPGRGGGGTGCYWLLGPPSLEPILSCTVSTLQVEFVQSRWAFMVDVFQDQAVRSEAG